MAKATKAAAAAADANEEALRKQAESLPFIDVAWPPPSDVPAEMLRFISVVVTSRSEKGRRRAGRAFSREATVIPVAELDTAEVEALVDDPELRVLARIPTAPPAG